MATQKARFQAALTHSTQYKDLFNSVIDEKVEALAALAQHAEDSWWSLAAAEFDVTGGLVGQHPTAVANLICANAATLMNNILSDLATLVGDTAKTVTAVWAAGSAKKTLYSPFVDTVTDSLLAKLLALRTLLAQAHDSGELAALMVTDGDENIHEWAYNAFIEFGPNFPEVLTSFHSMNSASETYNQPYLSVAVVGNDLVLINMPQKGETALAWDPNTAAGAAPLAQDDKVYINALTVPDTVDISEAIQTEGLSVKAIDGGAATIERTSRELFPDGFGYLSTDSGATLGDIFEIRIIERA